MLTIKKNNDSPGSKDLPYGSCLIFAVILKKVTQLTFTRFLNQYRIHHAKRLLMQEFTVSKPVMPVVLKTLSYFNRTF